jgi:hypothetical protein
MDANWVCTSASANQAPSARWTIIQKPRKRKSVQERQNGYSPKPTIRCKLLRNGVVYGGGDAPDNKFGKEPGSGDERE